MNWQLICHQNSWLIIWFANKCHLHQFTFHFCWLPLEMCDLPNVFGQVPFLVSLIVQLTRQSLSVLSMMNPRFQSNPSFFLNVLFSETSWCTSMFFFFFLRGRHMLPGLGHTARFISALRRSVLSVFYRTAVRPFSTTALWSKSATISHRPALIVGNPTINLPFGDGWNPTQQTWWWLGSSVFF